ncbi:hypothetical protein NDU88_006986 [Pleurodeles waltl]|uniref:Uncharacterized protein n=1 Tax=Pleurodeles waltl TaxID=8319 RepID=A0AAV7QJC0_PLEWA|nr:hypothetical protein NDU88_006986 [Pleurodeles waltl]
MQRRPLQMPRGHAQATRRDATFWRRRNEDPRVTRHRRTFAHIQSQKKKKKKKRIAASAHRGKRPHSTGPHRPAKQSQKDTQACLCGITAILLRRVQPTRRGHALQSEDRAPDGGDAPLQASKEKQRNASGETPEVKFNLRTLRCTVLQPGPPHTCPVSPASSTKPPDTRCATLHEK